MFPFESARQCTFDNVPALTKVPAKHNRYTPPFPLSFSKRENLDISCERIDSMYHLNKNCVLLGQPSQSSMDFPKLELDMNDSTLSNHKTNQYHTSTYDFIIESWPQALLMN